MQRHQGCVTTRHALSARAHTHTHTHTQRHTHTDTHTHTHRTCVLERWRQAVWLRHVTRHYLQARAATGATCGAAHATAATRTGHVQAWLHRASATAPAGTHTHACVQGFVKRRSRCPATQPCCAGLQMMCTLQCTLHLQAPESGAMRDEHACGSQHARARWAPRSAVHICLKAMHTRRGMPTGVRVYSTGSTLAAERRAAVCVTLGCPSCRALQRSTARDAPHTAAAHAQRATRASAAPRTHPSTHTRPQRAAASARRRRAARTSTHAPGSQRHVPLRGAHRASRTCCFISGLAERSLILGGVAHHGAHGPLCDGQQALDAFQPRGAARAQHNVDGHRGDPAGQVGLVRAMEGWCA
jgi:hypothetical protein